MVGTGCNPANGYYGRGGARSLRRSPATKFGLVVAVDPFVLDNRVSTECWQERNSTSPSELEGGSWNRNTKLSRWLETWFGGKGCSGAIWKRQGVLGISNKDMETSAIVYMFQNRTLRSKDSYPSS
ncbi:hypothetical protein J6590_086006 [Homalodisca vitripennis]|nr:hypothetical protein J6590_086006 [Homalodisca vitripennis]